MTKHASKGSTLALKPGETSSEVQNRGISGLTKRTHVLQNFLKNLILTVDCPHSEVFFTGVCPFIRGGGATLPRSFADGYLSLWFQVLSRRGEGEGTPN